MSPKIPTYMLLMGELVAFYEAALHYKTIPPETAAHWKERAQFLRSIDLFNLDAETIAKEIRDAKEVTRKLFQNPILPE